MKIEHIFVGAVFCLAVMTVTFGQTAAERLTGSGGAYSFQKAKGWTHRSNADGILLIDSLKTTLVAVKSHNYRDFEAFFADANLEHDGLELMGPPQKTRNGTYFRTAKRGSTTNVFDTFVTFSPFGGGAVIVGITEEKFADASFRAANSVADSIEYTKPKVTPAAGQVKAALSGKLLTYLFTGSGYSERVDIILCSSGDAYRTADSGGFSVNNSDGASYAALSQYAGTWRISPDGSSLLLTMNSGGTSEYRLAAGRSAKSCCTNCMWAAS
ncbi:MAG: hypothetical protein ABI539_00670, partial [Acidobacteriota bacterium]